MLGTNPNSSAAGYQPCDERVAPCTPPPSGEYQSGYPADGLSSRSYDTDTTTSYNFGNGQPLDLSYRNAEPPYREQQPKQIKLPPEPPTEFQKFVKADIGKMLPIYGSQFFTNAPSTFAPLDKVPVTPHYVIGPGDELLLRAWGSISFYLRETVDRSGNIYIPHVGLIQVSGIAFSDLHTYLYSHISSSFKKFELSVEMGHLRSIQIFIVGRVRIPGSYTVSSLSSLVNALFASGGLSNAGSMRHIQVLRDSKVITELDLYDFLLNGDKSKDISLLPGDVIFIPPAGGHVAVAGSISQPAVYEIRKNDTIRDVLAMAGGLTSLASVTSGELERIDDHGERHVIDIHFDESGLSTRVYDGDILQVFSIIPKFDNAVTLRGNVANPGRYAWHAGMRIRDLIPNKESLITRDYWKRTNSLVYRHMDEAESPGETLAGHFADSSASQNGTDASSVASTGDSADAAQHLREEDAQSPPDIKADKSSELQTAGQATANNKSIASQSEVPSDQFPVSNRVQMRAPEIDWDYAVVERMNSNDLTTTLMPFNLGNVLLGKSDTDNFELKPGDIVTIFSQADIHVPQSRQTKFVRLEGEFKGAGVYSVLPGETLRHLVQRAGGLTQQAYLYGSSFTRESTRLQQQARLNDYYSQLERQIDRASADRSNSAVNVQEAATLSASLESQRALAQKLRTLKATGRIVLNIPPGGHGIEDIPDLPLENGDTFVVPSKPASVSVVGSVYDQNAFIYTLSKEVGGYLELAGGITKYGDAKHMFIVRADGSVVSRKSSLAKTRGGLEALAMNPGDTIIVPEIVNKTTLLRGLTDWSSIFSQFGLGAAAINVLH